MKKKKYQDQSEPCLKLGPTLNLLFSSDEITLRKVKNKTKGGKKNVNRNQSKSTPRTYQRNDMIFTQTFGGKAPRGKKGDDSGYYYYGKFHAQKKERGRVVRPISRKLLSNKLVGERSRPGCRDGPNPNKRGTRKRVRNGRERKMGREAGVNGTRLCVCMYVYAFQRERERGSGV